MPVESERPKRRRSAPPAADGDRRPGRSESFEKVVGVEVDPELREYLREWRRATAKQHGVPAFVVMHDTSLEELCRLRPRSLSELLRVSGFGERKAELYGHEILDVLARFRNGARATAVPEQKSRPAQETMRLLAEGLTFDEIAKVRSRQLATIVSMVADLVEQGDLEFQPGWVNSEKQVSIEAACASLGLDRLRPLKEALPPEITFEELRLVVARLRRQQRQKRSIDDAESRGRGMEI
ncbi:MAG: HRDC domain-containing protein [Candidatus Acidiferrales bacterium]